MKSLIRKMFSSLGYTLQKTDWIAGDWHQSQNSMGEGFNRMKNIGIAPGTIIDIGAAQGTWTEKALVCWPAAKFELVEPLAEQKDILDKLKSKHPNIDYHLAVAGEVSGETFLTVSSDLDGSGVYGGNEENGRKVPVMTIDEIAANKPGNVLIKFDTHGYELPILKGATETLKRTSLLVVEVYGFHISPTCLIFHELSAFLDDQGFRLIDIVDIMRRPGDNAFWQADAFYIRKDNPVFNKNSYA